MAEQIEQRIAGRAAIINDGKVLIIRESGNYVEGTNEGKYDLPGGRIKPGEPLKLGLAREVKEECGLDVSIGEPIYVGEWNPIVNNRKLQIIAIYFKCSASNTDVALGSDHDDYKWIRPDEAREYNLMSPNPEVLKQLSI